MLETTTLDKSAAHEGSAFDFPKLYVHRDVFAQLQAIQRAQLSPKFDLKDIGSSALRIVFALPNATELIKERVMLDFLARRRRR